MVRNKARRLPRYRRPGRTAVRTFVYARSFIRHADVDGLGWIARRTRRLIECNPGQPDDMVAEAEGIGQIESLYPPTFGKDVTCDQVAP